ncbi:hypothetical protein [Limosilactobacillus antri]|uniref:hypothetical protein n=1 Tax=Limosilactobacillus antri TaxID=227943 RepID=UPI001F55C5E2|nr:hypothetical protein [Limosilactobacillus antri]
MTKDELIREINNCSSFCAFCYDGSTINIIAENLEDSIGHPENFMKFPDDVEYLEDISVNWEALKTRKNRFLNNVYALLDLVNDYVNTPVERRNWVGAQEHAFGQLKKKLEDKHNDIIRAITGCHIDESVGPTYELPQNGVIITLDDGQELHGKRAYNDIYPSDFDDKAIDFDNFIIPTAIIRSIQKCGDGNE